MTPKWHLRWPGKAFVEIGRGYPFWPYLFLGGSTLLGLEKGGSALAISRKVSCLPDDHSRLSHEPCCSVMLMCVLFVSHKIGDQTLQTCSFWVLNHLVLGSPIQKPPDIIQWNMFQCTIALNKKHVNFWIVICVFSTWKQQPLYSWKNRPTDASAYQSHLSLDEWWLKDKTIELLMVNYTPTHRDVFSMDNVRIALINHPYVW